MKYKNTESILSKTLIDTCIGGIMYWLVGYSFNFGDSKYGIIGFEPRLFAFSEIDESKYTADFYHNFFK